MTSQEFKASLAEKNPPNGISLNLKALWFEANGNWGKAHEIVQETSGTKGDWIHAYLHRREGDLSNASYWYSRIGKQLPDYSMNEEWIKLVSSCLDNQQLA